MDNMSADDGLTIDGTLSGRSCGVTVRRAAHDDHSVVAVRGVLSAEAGGGALRPVVATQLLDRGRVVVDLSEATLASDPVVEVFPAALADAGGWPLARLVLVRADSMVDRILQAWRVHLTVPLATSLGQARRLLDERPTRVIRDHELPYASMAPGLARSAVMSASEDWEFGAGLLEAALTVATELVGNAVEHAGTSCVLHLALDRQRLRIAVRDSGPVTEGRPQIGVRGDKGYGLLMVQGLSRDWGVTADAGGKTVWALLDAACDPLD